MSFVRYVKLRVPAGAAKPGPSLGQALGPLGIPMAEVCKTFNDQSTELYQKDVMLNVRLSAMSDRSFKIDIRSPSVPYLIKRVVGMDKGPGATNPTRPVATISPEAVYAIAKIKQKDDHMWHLPLEGIARSIVGTCRTMGVHVAADEPEDAGEKEVAA